MIWWSTVFAEWLFRIPETQETNNQRVFYTTEFYKETGKKKLWSLLTGAKTVLRIHCCSKAWLTYYWFYSMVFQVAPGMWEQMAGVCEPPISSLSLRRHLSQARLPPFFTPDYQSYGHSRNNEWLGYVDPVPQNL